MVLGRINCCGIISVELDWGKNIFMLGFVLSILFSFWL